MRIGALKIPTAIVSSIPRAEFLSCSIGLFSSRYLRMLRRRSFSSFVSFLTTATACSSNSPSGPFILASFGLTRYFSGLLFRSNARCLSASHTSSTIISNSPIGPGTSIGLTTSSLSLDCVIRILSASKISLIAVTAFDSASPKGPLMDSSKSFGRSVLDRDRSRSDCRTLSKKSTNCFSINPNGPNSPSGASASYGRTIIPPIRIICLARIASSSNTCRSQSTVDFSSMPNGPIFSSLASIGRT
mmetsp:Transcript_72322/g.202997  ORF Transcript_72322/g.202997 Transcript_72322/m.202997 type:complete len:245 (+) Transcript_72322:141-875(+)